MATQMPSSLEIAQEATLRPIAEIAEELGLSPDEYDLYGKYKAKVDLSVLERLADRPDGKLVCVTALTPTKAGEGKTTTSVSLTQGLGHIGRTVALCLREASLGPVFGIKGGAAGGGHAQVVPMEDMNLHFTGRHPRDRRGQQPARGHARSAPPAREQARHRPALDQLAPLRGHQRPRAPPDRARARRADERLPARDRLRHHRGLRGHGHPGRGPRPPRPAQPPGRDHRRLHARGRARHRRAAPGRRRDDRPPEGRDQAEPRADARGPAGVRPLRAVRQHRARQQLARRRPRRAQARRRTSSPRAASAPTWAWRSSSTSSAGSAGCGRARSAWSRPCARSSTTAATRTAASRRSSAARRTCAATSASSGSSG